MNFLDLYPPGHPYLQLYKKHARMFGSSNVLVVAVEVKEGDIFTVETLNKIDRLTVALMETPGVNPWQVLSISHPKARNIRVTSAGIDLMPTSWYPCSTSAQPRTTVANPNHCANPWSVESLTASSARR